MSIVFESYQNIKLYIIIMLQVGKIDCLQFKYIMN